MINKFQDTIYRRHTIKTRQYGNEWRAAAFRGKTKVTDNLCAVTETLAILAVQYNLDELAAEQKEKRGDDGFPTADEVRAALQVLKINKSQEAMLSAHINEPDHVLTATQLANAADYDDYNAVNLWYGKLGLDLSVELGWTPQEKDVHGKTIWTFTLATDAGRKARKEGEEITGHWRWKLRPEIIEAWTK